MVTNSKYPFRLIFEAQVSTPELEPVWPYATTDIPFQKNIKNSLTTVGQLLFNVYAYEYPEDLKDSTKLQLIGKIISDSKAENSVWADEKLLITHMPTEEDLETQPDWEKYLPRYTPNYFEIDWN